MRLLPRPRISQTCSGEPVWVVDVLLLSWEVLEDSRRAFVSTWILNFPGAPYRFLPVPGSGAISTQPPALNNTRVMRVREKNKLNVAAATEVSAVPGNAQVEQR